MSANSQTLTWSAQTAAVTVTPNPDVYAKTVIIENESGQVCYARYDGTAAVAAAAGTAEIPSGSIVILLNEGPLPNSNTTPNADQSESEGWTAQTAYTPGTTLSIIPAASATGTVNVTFQ